MKNNEINKKLIKIYILEPLPNHTSMSYVSSYQIATIIILV